MNPVAEERPGSRFISWVADDETRVERVLAWASSQGVKGPISRWSESDLRACREHLLRKGSSAAAVQAQVLVPADFGIRSGKDFYFYLRKIAHEQGVALVEYVVEWGLQRGYPDRMFSWSLVQVAEGLAESQRKLGSLAPEVAADPPAEVAPSGAPSEMAPETQANLQWMRQRLYDYALEVIALNWPGRKPSGKDIAQVCAGWTELDAQRRKLSTIRGCTDFSLLADFLSIASEQVHRLKSVGQQSLLPEAPLPTLSPEQLSLFGAIPAVPEEPETGEP